MRFHQLSPLIIIALSVCCFAVLVTVVALTYLT